MRTKRNRVISITGATEGLGALVEYGGKCHPDERPLSHWPAGSPVYRAKLAKLLGTALTEVVDREDLIDLFITVLERNRENFLLAVVKACNKGQGVVKHKGRMVTIELPEEWEDA